MRVRVCVYVCVRACVRVCSRARARARIPSSSFIPFPPPPHLERNPLVVVGHQRNVVRHRLPNVAIKLWCRYKKGYLCQSWAWHSSAAACLRVMQDTELEKLWRCSDLVRPVQCTVCALDRATPLSATACPSLPPPPASLSSITHHFLHSVPPFFVRDER